MNSNIVALPQLGTVQLISNARRALAEARTLPDFRRVMEAATVAADAAHRAAKLMEAQGMAAEVAQAANEAANDAAAVRIEAQAGAGRILREMQDAGQLAKRGDYGRRAQDQIPKQGNTEPPQRVEADLGISHSSADRWKRVAGVSEGVRADYVEATKAEGGEITTAGLLRYARAAEEAPPEREPTITDTLEKAYAAVSEAMAVFAKYRNAGAIAAFAADSRRKSRFRELVNRSRTWLDEAEQVLK